MLILRKMIDEMEAARKDYLRIFTLSSENGEQKIIHEQEQPDYRKEYVEIIQNKPIWEVTLMFNEYSDIVTVEELCDFNIE